MRRLIATLLAVVFSAVVARADDSAPAQVRVGDHDGFGRVVIDLTGPTSYRVIRNGARVTVVLDGDAVINPPSGVPRNVRSMTGGIGRAEIVTATGAAVRDWRNGRRVVIDVFDPDASAAEQARPAGGEVLAGAPKAADSGTQAGERPPPAGVSASANVALGAVRTTPGTAPVLAGSPPNSAPPSASPATQAAAPAKPGPAASPSAASPPVAKNLATVRPASSPIQAEPVALTGSQADNPPPVNPPAVASAMAVPRPAAPAKPTPLAASSRSGRAPAAAAPSGAPPPGASGSPPPALPSSASPLAALPGGPQAGAPRAASSAPPPSPAVNRLPRSPTQAVVPQPAADAARSQTANRVPPAASAGAGQAPPPLPRRQSRLRRPSPHRWRPAPRALPARPPRSPCPSIRRSARRPFAVATPPSWCSISAARSI